MASTHLCGKCRRTRPSRRETGVHGARPRNVAPQHRLRPPATSAAVAMSKRRTYCSQAAAIIYTRDHVYSTVPHVRRRRSRRVRVRVRARVAFGADGLLVERKRACPNPRPQRSTFPCGSALTKEYHCKRLPPSGTSSWCTPTSRANSAGGAVSAHRRRTARRCAKARENHLPGAASWGVVFAQALRQPWPTGVT